MALPHTKRYKFLYSLLFQILDRVADGMAFGALLPCEECKGQFVFKSDAYYCSGDITAWTKCVAKTQTPNRKDWVIPKVGVNCKYDDLKHAS